jgi:hypothetical protein
LIQVYSLMILKKFKNKFIHHIKKFMIYNQMNIIQQENFQFKPSFYKV